jgi:geranylgeranyl diphosphate synthase type II
MSSDGEAVAHAEPKGEATDGGLEAIELRRRIVEEALAASLPSEDAWPETLHRAVRYSLFAGGKRIRPILVLAAGEAVGGEREELLPLACAVEMIHTYSLVHDDLPAMDDDELRRGQPTSHKVFGEANAILAGDALLTRAFHLLAEVPEESDEGLLRRRLRATALLGEACGSQGLVGGQVVDLESAGREIAISDLERLHRAKTGALLSACVRGGAILGGASANQLQGLSQYGAALGLAFQVVDDILDATEGAERLGKTPGKDRSAGKITYVSVFGLDGARQKAQELQHEALDSLSPLGPRSEMLATIARLAVERHG